MVDQVELTSGAVLQLLRQWEAASDAGDRDAAVHLERTIIEGPAPSDDGTGEARAEIGKVFVQALKAGTDEAARQVLGKSRDRLKAAVGVLGGGFDEEDEDDDFVSASRVRGDAPTPLLSLSGKPGYVLGEGSLTILSGSGGIGKTALVKQLALGFAMAPDDRAPMYGDLFDAPTGGGPVVYMSFEDPSALLRDGLGEVARALDYPGALAAVDRIFLKRKGRCRALFGPTDRGESSGLYNAEPGPLPGWRIAERAVRRARPRLLILDPVLSAYTGDSNTAAPVRHFLEALTGFAEAHALGVLLVAHSTKAVRRGKQDVMDPGQVGGSGHWYDTVRGVLVLNRGDGNDHRARLLACPKANRGPDRLLMPLDGVFGPQGEYLGFVPADDLGWRYPPLPKDHKAGRANGNTRRGKGVQDQFAPGVE